MLLHFLHSHFLIYHSTFSTPIFSNITPLSPLPFSQISLHFLHSYFLKCYKFFSTPTFSNITPFTAEIGCSQFDVDNCNSRLADQLNTSDRIVEINVLLCKDLFARVSLVVSISSLMIIISSLINIMTSLMIICYLL